MKRNKLMMTAAIAGSVLLVSSIAAFAASGSGYQEFKKAVKAVAFLENATVSVDVELKDNGSIIMSGNSLVMDDNLQSEQSNSYMSSSFVVDGKTHKMESSRVNGQLITNIDGQYTMYQMNLPDAETERSQVIRENSSTMKLAEMLVDTLVGDVRNQFVKNGDLITVNLEGAQIPELARLGISAMLENAKELSKRDLEQDEAMQTLFSRISQLETVNVKYLGAQATLEEGILMDSFYQAIVTGTDTNGVLHEFEIDMTVKVSDIGTTVPKSIDTTGKNVKHIDYFDTDAMSKMVVEMKNNGASEEEIEAYIEEMHRSGSAMRGVEFTF